MNTGNISFLRKKFQKCSAYSGYGNRHTDWICYFDSVVYCDRRKIECCRRSAWMYFVVLAFFCVLWGVMSYDDAKTNQKYKISGICINIVAIFIGITLS